MSTSNVSQNRSRSFGAAVTRPYPSAGSPLRDNRADSGVDGGTNNRTHVTEPKKLSHSDQLFSDAHLTGDRAEENALSLKIRTFFDSLSGSTLKNLSDAPVQELDSRSETVVINTILRLFNGLSNDETIEAVKIIEKIGHITDQARIIAASALQQKEKESLTKDSGSNLTSSVRFQKITSAKNEGFANLYGCKNEFELLQRLTNTSRSAAVKRLKLARTLFPEGPQIFIDQDAADPNEFGESMHEQDLAENDSETSVSDSSEQAFLASIKDTSFKAVTLGIAEGVLPIETGEHIINKLSQLTLAVDSSTIAVAELSLVSAAIGATQPDLNSFAPQQPSDSDFKTNVFETARHLIKETATHGPTEIPQTTDRIKKLAHVVTETLQKTGNPTTDEQTLNQRYFYIGAEKNGLVNVHGKIAPEIAALLARVMDAHLSPRIRKKNDPQNIDASQNEIEGADQSDGTNGTEGTDGSGSKDRTDGTDELAETDHRTPGQKKHDVLATIVQIAAKSQTTPRLGQAPVTVMLQVREEDYLKEIAEKAAEKAAQKATQNKKSSPHEHNGNHFLGYIQDHEGQQSPINSEIIKHAGCSGEIQRIVFNDQNKIVALGTSERIFDYNQRRAIITRDGQCIIPGCTIPATWCEIHHVTEHAKGGATHTDNGVALCWYHHRSLDHSGWEIKMLDGSPWLKPPKWLNPDQKWFKHRPLSETAHILT